MFPAGGRRAQPHLMALKLSYYGSAGIARHHRFRWPFPRKYASDRLRSRLAVSEREPLIREKNIFRKVRMDIPVVMQCVLWIPVACLYHTRAGRVLSAGDPG
jgi:hypothetical protein